MSLSDTDLEFLRCVLMDELSVGAAFWEKWEVSVTQCAYRW